MHVYQFVCRELSYRFVVEDREQLIVCELIFMARIVQLRRADCFGVDD